MNREPFYSSPSTSASGPPGSGVAHKFEVVFQAPPTNERILLQSATDANAATMAFHEALQRLTTQRATGELVVLQHHAAHLPILRQPLGHGGAKSSHLR